MIGTRLAHYEITSHLGSGGMGEVYAARDAKLGRTVALKLLPSAVAHDAERIARFQREARVLASLNHPHIAVIHGIESIDGRHFLVMEMVDGETVAERIARGPVPVDEALDIARQIIDALDTAHQRGIVHRDLKPANIKISKAATVKLLDFGLAKDAESSRLSQAPTITDVGTRAGVVLGTAAYMSPEQARGLEIDKRADIWAFGCVLYEMLTAQRAFHGDTLPEVSAAILTKEPDWSALPDSVPATVRTLLPRLLMKDPKRRLRDVADATLLLEPIDEAHGSTPAARDMEGKLRHWRLTAAVMSVAALALLASRWPTFRVGQAPPPGFGSETIVSQLTNFDGTEAGGAISPDGRAFVFVSSHSGNPDIFLRQVSGGEPVRLTDDAAVEMAPVFAPDGDSVFFTRTAAGDTSIWRVGALGGQARKVVSDARMPALSPDGQRIAYLRPRSDDGFDLHVADVDGSNARVLVAPVLAVGVSAAAWSPDGNRLAYTMGGLFAPSNLFVADATSGEARQVTSFTRSTEGTRAQAWLPDGRHVLVTYSASPRAQGPGDLGLVEVESGQIVRLTANASVSFGAPSVSSDGHRVIVTASETQRELWKVPFGPDPLANGKAATRLLDASHDPTWVYVTRDGSTVLFNNALVGSRNLWMAPLGAAEPPRQITAVPGDAVMHASLSPDRTRVAFASSARGNSDIWVQNVDGSDLRQITDDTAADAWPVWSPDGGTILFASLRANTWKTRRSAPSGGRVEEFADGFFRGDWIAHPTGDGTLIVTSEGGAAGGIRLLDGETGRVLWAERRPGNAMPMFSADGRMASVAYTENRDRDAIWVYDVATGQGRVAVRFPGRFHLSFRASWVDNDRAFIVNRLESLSHIVLLDRFRTAAPRASQ